MPSCNFSYDSLVIAKDGVKIAESLKSSVFDALDNNEADLVPFYAYKLMFI